MIEWFRSLQTREQYILLAGAAFVAFAIAGSGHSTGRHGGNPAAPGRQQPVANPRRRQHARREGSVECLQEQRRCRQ